MFPILNPLPPPSSYSPSRSSQCTSPKHPVLNLDWWFVSYTILYMFQCNSPKSSHPFPLPQSPKDCSIHLCLFCCLAYRVIVAIFLNSIYALVYCIGVFLVLVFFFLAYLTLYNRLQFHPPHQNWFKYILFNGWVILHCVYVPQLSYPFVCQWTSGCFHALVFVNSAAMNIGVHVSLSILVSSMCMPSSGIAGSYGSSISSFFKESPHFSP